MPPDLILPPAANEPAAIDPVNCTACKFYRMNNVLVPRMGGGCRFMPPTPQVVGMEAHPMGQRPITMAFWPAVGETDWCGQWAPNKDKADA